MLHAEMSLWGAAFTDKIVDIKLSMLHSETCSEYIYLIKLQSLLFDNRT